MLRSVSATVKRLLPARLRAWLLDLRALDGAARGALARLTLLRLAGLRRDEVPPAPPGGHVVLFVCHGNIMRSAFGAALLRARVPAGAVQVLSAGTHARDGRAADPRAAAEATAHGVSLAEHRASALTDALVARASLVLVMDRRNEAHLVARFPWAARKVARLGAFAARDGVHGTLLPDPYLGDDGEVRRSFARIAPAVDALAARLLTRQAPPPA